MVVRYKLIDDDKRAMSYILFWFLSAVLLGVTSSDLPVSFQKSAWAFLGSLLLIAILGALRSYRAIPYLLFFAISITSLLGLSKTLTGSHAESSMPILFGLSFYTASIAYIISTQDRISLNNVWKVSNPLLLFTGPIALYVKNIRYRKLITRITYFLPFIVVGIFYFQIVGAPLVVYMFLLNEVDIVSALLFAAIFELFVYANFCGLSLMVYGLCGIFGFRVPLNFKQPFSSTNVIDFWKGWHLSLSMVLKELFYTKLRRRIGLFGALISVYLASAMWHGITLNFLLWGAFHAVMFYVTILVLKSNFPLKSILTAMFMFLAIVVGRLLFADSDTNRLLEKLCFEFVDFRAVNMIASVPLSSLLSLFMGIFLVLIEILFRNCRHVRNRTYKYLRLPFS